jgi:hypothetical protein
LGRWLCQVAFAALCVIVLSTAANAVQLSPCGEVTAPVCGGVCPSGQRCVPTFAVIDIFVVLNGQMSQPPSPGNAPPEEECQCIEALCGGVTLADGQGCCNGVPYQIGVQGCCDGQLQAVDAPCDCTDDLSASGCCSIVFDGQPQIIEYPPDIAACCQHSLTIAGFPATTLSVYTLNAGVDCCGAAGAPQLCGGTCEGSECAATGCCTCSDCLTTNEAFCAAADTELGCAAACFLEGLCFENPARFDNGVCSEAGNCRLTNPAEAPAVSNAGLFAAIGLLTLVAGGAFARRRMSPQ